MFFIVSTGRSGTTTLAKTLSLLHGCVSLHEPHPELILESSLYHYGDYSKEKIERNLLESRKPLAERGIYCESNQTLSLIIPVLSEVFPKARFVWLMRNGLDVVASTYQKQWYSGHSENHSRYEDCPPLEKMWIDGRIRGDRAGFMTEEAWARMSRFDKCCWYWSYVNGVIENDLNSQARDRFCMLRLEELANELPGLIRWMGLKAVIVPPPKRHNVAKREPYHWEKWSEAERRTFQYWCGEMMDRFYPNWRSSTGEWNGVTCQEVSGIYERLGGNEKIVKTLNALFARNRI